MKTTGWQGWFNRNSAWVLAFFAGAIVALTLYDFTTGPPEGTVCEEAASEVVECTYTVTHTGLSSLAFETLSNEEVARQVWGVHTSRTMTVFQLLGVLFFLAVVGLMIRAKRKAREDGKAKPQSARDYGW